jgi:Domain of unknown function (DUF5069)
LTPLDLRTHRPRSVRATILGFYLVPRTIDKLRAELPGGNLGPYVNHDTGFSAYVIRRMGLEMNDFRNAVAAASDEDAVIAWLAARVDTTLAPTVNAKLESFVVERMSAEDRALVRERHPVMEQRPELSVVLDILEADDELTFA